MTEHLPECPILKPCCDDEEFPEHGFCGNFVGRCLHCMAECICDALRACETRVIATAMQRIEALWSLDPSWDGTKRNNALTSALAAINTPREN